MTILLASHPDTVAQAVIEASGPSAYFIWYPGTGASHVLGFKWVDIVDPMDVHNTLKTIDASTEEYDTVIANHPVGLIGVSDPNAWDGARDFVEFVRGICLVKPKKIDGSSCVKCNSYCQHSEPNQANGTFVCFSCRR